MSTLKQLASHLAERNDIDKEIADLIRRPAIRGHIGEWIAQEIFRVTLEKDAARKIFDGRFADGPLAGKTVNVKWYGKRERVLDINPDPDGVLDYYLVMTGPKARATNSRGQTRPLMIKEVFLFDAPALVKEFRVQKRRLGVASYVRQHEWEAAMVYPEAASSARLTLTDAKREELTLFAGAPHPRPKRPGEPSRAGPVNGCAVLRSAAALRVTHPARSGSASTLGPTGAQRQTH